MSEVAPFKFFDVTVKSFQQVSKSLLRVTFTGPELEHFGDPGFDQRIKLLFPNEHRSFEGLCLNPNWYQAWREMPDEIRPPIRTYTTRYVRPELLEIDVDMVIHPPAVGKDGVAKHGPAGEWLENIADGARVIILGPDARFEGEPGGVDFVPPKQTDHYLLVGDETAAPAIACILEQLPKTAQGTVVLEVASNLDSNYLPEHPGFNINYAPREIGEDLGGEPSAQSDLAYGSQMVRVAESKISELCAPATGHQVEEINVDEDLLWEVPRHAKGGAALSSTTLFAWIAGEAQAVKTLRRSLVTDHGIDRRTVAFMGYWREGKAEN